ncbi:mitochondrial fission ELM1 family protein [Rhodovibrionaceae bacterium A322]
MTEQSQITHCWAVSDGRAGMESQSLGLAEALCERPSIKRLSVRLPWRWLPPQFWPSPLDALSPRENEFSPPWPQVMIATGRRVIAPALAARRSAQGKCFVILMQHPRINPARADLVIAPEHDGLTGPNVITTLGSVNRLTQDKLDKAVVDFQDQLADLPRPFTTVLIGGPSKAHSMPADHMQRFATQLADAIRNSGGSALITTSRRTGQANEDILRSALKDLPGVFWDGQGANPYFAFLGVADALVVTCDSVNMLCEAAFTGKPVHLVDLPGGTAKFRRFHNSLAQAGITRPFNGELEHWSYTPLNETARVAKEVKRRIRQSGVLD